MRGNSEAEERPPGSGRSNNSWYSYRAGNCLYSQNNCGNKSGRVEMPHNAQGIGSSPQTGTALVMGID